MAIKLCLASPAHPESIGQVKRPNPEILKALKIKLKKHGDSWTEELQAVLWANRTTPSCPPIKANFGLTSGHNDQPGYTKRQC
uniref:Uncharacterized protein n=1 Tax=Oryza brachyantha TaxID=4533 RepID=J3LCN7_ORYBR